MWAIIYLVCALPLLGSLWYGGFVAKRSGALVEYKTPFQHLGFTKLAVALFWQLDVIGIILVIAVFSLILVPLSIAGSAKEAWKAGHIIAMIVIGVACIPALIFWELKTKHPLLPFNVCWLFVLEKKSKLMSVPADERPRSMGCIGCCNAVELYLVPPGRVSYLPLPLFNTMLTSFQISLHRTHRCIRRITHFSQPSHQCLLFLQHCHRNSRWCGC